MYKQFFTLSICISTLCALLYGTGLYAQWSMPSDQTTDAPAPIHTGNQLQYKKGPLQFVLKNAESPDYRKWIDPNWTATTGYAIDTDAPISAHGAVFTGKLLTPSILDTSMASDVPGNSEICADKNGKYVKCALANTDSDRFSMLTTLSVQPTTIPNNMPTPVTITWSNTGGDSCVGLQGPGFITDGKKNGTQASMPLVLQNNEKQVFTLVCTDSFGRSQFASSLVNTATTVLPAPVLNFYFSSPTPMVVANIAVASSASSDVTMQLSIDPNGGGTVQCRKQVLGSAIKSSNPWSGQAAGVWTAYTTLPPNTVKDINTCRSNGMCTAGDIISDINTNAVLVLECKNASGNARTANNHLSISH